MTTPQAPTLAYDRPSWSATPPLKHTWAFDVIKNGIPLSPVPFPKHLSMLTVGRLPLCDIELEHETISRYHAILQFSQNDEELFLYNLSTNGTLLNRQPVPLRTHTQVYVGDTIQFGLSTRTFIIVGPLQHRRPDLEMNLVQDQDDIDKPIRKSPPVNQSPPHTTSSNDPKDIRKQLTNWLDARGLPLNITVENDELFKHSKRHSSGIQQQFKATLVVPLDADTVNEDDTSGQKSITGIGVGTRKRIAELEAMQSVLDQLNELGYLHARVGESVQSSRIRSMLEAIDAEDNVPDEFLDRTLTTSRPVTNTKTVVETYESLCAKLTSVETRKLAVGSEIERLNAKLDADDSNQDQDDLDLYMSSLKSDCTKQELVRLNKELVSLESEIAKVTRLVGIAKPPEATVPKPIKRPRDLHQEEDTGRSCKIQKVAPESSLSALLNSIPTGPNDDVEGSDCPLPTSLSTPKKNDNMCPSDDLLDHERVVEWLPPVGQSGDGKTKLNQQFGY